jgi:hypothetical protein
LLVDIGTYMRHGLVLPGSGAPGLIEALVTNWLAWDKQVTVLMAGLRLGRPHGTTVLQLVVPAG